MAGMINELLLLLNEQHQRCEELLGLSREKRDVIIANDVEALQKITHLENMIVSQNQKLERKRQALVDDMAAVMGQKADTLTITALAELLAGQEEQEALQEIGGRLRETLEALAAVNAQNASLIDNALDYIEYTLNVIRSSAGVNPALYTAKGEQITENAGIFDAKH